MKICAWGVADLAPGKYSVKDERLDRAEKLVKAKKKTPVQVEVVGVDALRDADAIVILPEARTDLVLQDLEFVETRLGRASDEAERALLQRMKEALEKEAFLSTLSFSDAERGLLSGSSVVTQKPVVVAGADECADRNALLARILKESGYICFLTAGEKEARAWLIRKGTCAWEAAGAIHTDIQKGFIRAEIIGYADYDACGGETAAKQAGKMRLEPKEYLMQDADVVMFRFNR